MPLQLVQDLLFAHNLQKRNVISLAKYRVSLSIREAHLENSQHALRHLNPCIKIMASSIRFGWFFLFYSWCIAAQAQSVKAEAITIEQGLSQGMIFDLCQTRDGFLWIATKDGLNRYDGYNFKAFSNNPFDPFSLAENIVTALFEDSRGWLWVGTESKGLDLYDRRKRRFHHFPLNFKRDENISTFDILNITEAPDGSIFLLQKGHGVLKIDIPASWQTQLPTEPDLSRFTRIRQLPIHWQQQSQRYNMDNLLTLKRLDDGRIRAFSNKAPFLVDFHPDAEAGVEVPADAESDTWVASSFSLRHFLHGQPTTPDFPPGLNISWTMSKPADDHTTWVSINNQLWHLSAQEEIDFSNPDWVIDVDISTVLTDRNGNIWVGTHGYGLRKINPRKKLFHTGAAGTSIWGVWRDAQGKYYCKVVNQVFPYDPATGLVGRERAFPNGPERILDMHVEPSGGIWVLGRDHVENGQGLLQYLNPADGSSRRYTFNYYPYVYSRLLRSRDGSFWITGYNCQLVRFYPQTARFEYLDYSRVFGGQSSTARAYALAEDGNGTLWIGTQKGLVRCTPNAQSFDFTLLQADPRNPKGLNNNSIAALLPDPVNPDQVLWIGTKGGGINRLDLQRGQFQHINTTAGIGLPDNVIYGILPGNENPDHAAVSLWCSTNRGLVKLTPQKTEPLSFDITTFTAAEGLQDNEFNTQAYFKAGNSGAAGQGGELLFGGVNGLNHFFPEAVQNDTTPTPVFIVGLQINHQSVVFNADPSAANLLDAPMEYLRKLQLNHDQNNLTFEFAALDFTVPAKNRYRYRLLGLDPDWVETGNNRFAHFTHLAPGRYTLQVQGSNGEGVWQDAVNTIEITVAPPWWRSNIAYLAYSLLLLWAGWQAYRFQIRRVQLREQLAYEHRENERVKALEQMKTNFFSNVTHEFRTPLTLILEPARRILAKSDEADTREYARLIENNSRQLLRLVNQLLEMAKLENEIETSGSIDLRHGDFVETLRNVFQTFLPLAEQKGIALSLQVAPQIGPFMFDADKTAIILNNLLSNALKFSPEGGKVTVSCQQASKAVAGAAGDHRGLQIQVSDSGIGIPANALDKIFDRFYQADNAQRQAGAGTGIGLALSKELAERMGGEINVKSEMGKGSTFTLWLPANEIAGAPEPATAIAEPQTRNPSKQKPADWQAAADLPMLLLSEDNAELRGFIKQNVSEQWQVVEASNGEEAVRKAKEIIPDLIISDVMMPFKDGFTLCDELKNDELTAHIPVILLTAKSDMSSKIKGLRTGADDYLTKPFNTEELLVRMENLVEMRRRLRQRFSQLPQDGLADARPENATFLTTPDREFLRRFTLEVEQHLSDESVGVNDFAQKMFVSRVQLHRKLKALTDRNVTDFVRDYRLNRAMSMLKNKEGKVYEVASRVGFGSEKYFSRAFKEKFGMPPSHIR